MMKFLIFYVHQTALYKALYKNNIGIAKLLLNNPKIDVNIKSIEFLNI